MGLAARRAALILTHSTEIYDTVNGPAAVPRRLQASHPTPQAGLIPG